MPAPAHTRLKPWWPNYLIVNNTVCDIRGMGVVQAQRIVDLTTRTINNAKASSLVELRLRPKKDSK